jgi:hypothetical protein
MVPSVKVESALALPPVLDHLRWNVPDAIGPHQWGCPKSQTALFDFPFDAHFYGYLWVLPIRKMPLSGIFSHFGLSKKKNLSFLDSPKQRFLAVAFLADTRGMCYSIIP